MEEIKYSKARNAVPVFRCFGALGIALSVAIASALPGIGHRLIYYEGVDPIRASGDVAIPLYFLVVGIGLLKLKRWAALGFSLPFGLFGAFWLGWLIFGGFESEPIFAIAFSIVFSLWMFVPIAATVFFWPELKAAITNVKK